MHDVDLAIIGGGIAGASVAWRLASQRRVLLIERESQCGYHTTGRSAALYMESYGPPGVRALTRASRAFFEQPPAGFSDVPLLGPRGVLHLAFEGQQAALDHAHAELAPGCPRLQVLDTAAALALAPCLRADRVIGALLDPDAQDMDVDAIHQGFLRGFRRGGGTLRTGTGVAGAEHRGDGWRLTLDDGTVVTATTVVNAAGAWADALALLFGVAPVGIVPMRRSAFTFDAGAGHDSTAWPALVAIDESWYIKPGHGQLLGSPANADPTTPHDVVPEEIDIATGIWRIEEVTTLTIRRPTSTWAGLRSFVADGELVIGFDDAEPGFFWLAGQGGYGIQSAAGASELAATLLLGAPLPDALKRHGVVPAASAPTRLR